MQLAEFLSAKNSAISQWTELKLQITNHNSAVSQPFEVKFFMMTSTWRGSNFLKISIFWRPWGKFKSIFELAVNLSLVFTKLDTELDLAQPQLLNLLRWFFFDFLNEEDLIFLKSQFSEANGENWSPFLSFDYLKKSSSNIYLELGTAQPQLVSYILTTTSTLLVPATN